MTDENVITSAVPASNQDPTTVPPMEPTVEPSPAPAAPVAPDTSGSETFEPVTSPSEDQPNVDVLADSPPAETKESDVEESFFKKNKLLLIGGAVALILVTVTTGVLLSMKNADNLQGMILKAKEYHDQVQENNISKDLPTLPENTD